MLDVSDLHTYYGESHILQGLSLRVERGSCVAVLGRNGVGKTTLIRSIVGTTRPRAGKVVYKGEDIAGLPPFRITRMGIALVPQGRRIFPSLTVRENLAIAMRPPRRDNGHVTVWDFERVFSLFPRLAERLKQRGGSLSGGEQQMLATARALVSNPELLLMDEPSEGLAPMLLRDLGEVMDRLKQEGLSTLLVEQKLPFALRHADYVYVMSKGAIVYAGAPDALWRDEAVKSRYLGVW